MASADLAVLDIDKLRLQIIDVGQNDLTGDVGLLLSNTPFLFSFHVDGNNMEGTIPDDFASYSLKVRAQMLLSGVCLGICLN